MQHEEVWSEYRKRRVRVIYVGAQPGQYRSVAKALLAANEGDRIEVQGGRYPEGLVVSKNVEVVGCDGEAPELAFRGTVLTFAGAGRDAIVANIEFIQLEKGHDAFTVRIPEGRPHLIQCKFSSVLVSGEASPTLIANTISGSMGSGVTLRGGGGGRFAKNRIFSHMEYCVDADTSGETEFLENRIWGMQADSAAGGQQQQQGLSSGSPRSFRRRSVVTERPPVRSLVIVSGVRSCGRCCPKFLSNYISDVGEICMAGRPPYCPGAPESRASVIFTGDASGVFTDNDVTGGMTGLRIEGGSSLHVEDNMIAKQDLYGIHIVADSESKVFRNRVKDCTHSGIRVCGCCIVSNNLVYNGQTGHGISVACDVDGLLELPQEGALVPDILQNTVEGVSGCGIYCETGTATIRSNVLQCIQSHGIMVKGPANLHLIEGNTVENASLYGIAVESSCEMSQILRNTLTSNSTGGVLLCNGSNPFFSENTVTGSPSAFTMSQGSRGTLMGNTVKSCANGFVSESQSNPFVFQNSILMNDYGVVVHKCGCGVFSSNTVMRNKVAGLLIDSGDPEVLDNDIQQNGQYGLIINPGALGIYVQNTLKANGLASCIVYGGAFPTLRRNNFTVTAPNSQDTGAIFEEGSGGVFEKNYITNHGIGVLLRGEAAGPQVLSNAFYSCVKHAVSCEAHAAGVLRYNTIQLSGISGIALAGGVTTVCTANTFLKQNTCLLISGPGTSPRVQDNVFAESADTAVIVTDRADPTLSGNTFENNLRVGLLCEQHCRGTFSGNSFRGNPVAISVATWAVPEVSGNKISGSTIAAVQLSRSAGGNVSDNTLSDSHVGVLCAGHAATNVLKNQILSNNFGVRCYQKIHTASLLAMHATEKPGAGPGAASPAEATPPAEGAGVAAEGIVAPGGATEAPGEVRFADNVISKSAAVNVLVELKGFLFAEKNTITDSPVGVLLREGGSGRFVENNISRNVECNVQVLENSTPFLEKNVITRSAVGIDISRKGKGTFIRNKLSRNTVQIDVHSSGDPTVQHCELNQCPRSGIVVRDGGRGSFSDNTFNSNGACGVEVARDASPLIVNNTMSDNAAFGIYFHSGSSGEVRGNVITGNRKGGILIDTLSTQVRVSRNSIAGNVCGVVVRGSCTPLISRNDISGNRFCGILSLSSAPLLEQNKITGERVGAAAAGAGANPTLTGNLFCENAVGVHLFHGADAVISENLFSFNASGARFSHDARGALRGNHFIQNAVAAEVFPSASSEITMNSFEGCRSLRPCVMSLGIPEPPPRAARRRGSGSGSDSSGSESDSEGSTPPVSPKFQSFFALARARGAGGAAAGGGGGSFAGSLPPQDLSRRMLQGFDDAVRTPRKSSASPTPFPPAASRRTSHPLLLSGVTPTSTTVRGAGSCHLGLSLHGPAKVQGNRFTWLTSAVLLGDPLASDPSAAFEDGILEYMAGVEGHSCDGGSTPSSSRRRHHPALPPEFTARPSPSAVASSLAEHRAWVKSCVSHGDAVEVTCNTFRSNGRSLVASGAPTSVAVVCSNRFYRDGVSAVVLPGARLLCEGNDFEGSRCCVIFNQADGEEEPESGVLNHRDSTLSTLSMRELRSASSFRRGSSIATIRSQPPPRHPTVDASEGSVCAADGFSLSSPRRRGTQQPGATLGGPAVSGGDAKKRAVSVGPAAQQGGDGGVAGRLGLRRMSARRGSAVSPTSPASPAAEAAAPPEVCGVATGVFVGNTFSNNTRCVWFKGGVPSASERRAQQDAAQPAARTSDLSGGKVLRNRFEENAEGAVCTAGATGLLEDNLFSENRQCGVSLLSEAAVVVRRNFFTGHGGSLGGGGGGSGAAEAPAVLAAQGGGGFVDSNTFFRNGVSVSIVSHSTCVFTGNCIVRSAVAGFHAGPHAKGSVVKNTFECNASDVICTSSSSTSFSHNTLQSDQSALCDGSCRPSFKSNTILGSVRIAESATPSFRANVFAIGGVTITRGAAGVFTSNVFYGRGLPSHIAEHNAVGRELTGRAGFGSYPIAQTPHSQGHAEAPHASPRAARGGSQQGGDQGTAPLPPPAPVAGGGGGGGGGGGVGDGAPKTPTQRGEGGAVAGVVPMVDVSGGDPRFDGNTFLQCALGLAVRQGGKGQYVNNLFHGGRIGVEVRRQGCPAFGQGNIFEMQERGIVVSGVQTGGRFDRCEVTGATGTGVVVEKQADPDFQSTDVSECRVGIHITRLGRGTFTDCSVFSNKHTGVAIDADCHPSLMQCRISTAMDSGALSRESGAGALEDCKVKHQFTPPFARRNSRPDRGEGGRPEPLTHKEETSERLVSAQQASATDAVLAGVASAQRWRVDVTLSVAERNTQLARAKSRERERSSSVDANAANAAARRRASSKRQSDAMDWASASMSLCSEELAARPPLEEAALVQGSHSPDRGQGGVAPWGEERQRFASVPVEEGRRRGTVVGFRKESRGEGPARRGSAAPRRGSKAKGARKSVALQELLAYGGSEYDIGAMSPTADDVPDPFSGFMPLDGMPKAHRPVPAERGVEEEEEEGKERAEAAAGNQEGESGVARVGSVSYAVG